MMLYQNKKKVNFSIDTRNFKLMFIHILKSNSYYYNNGNN